MQTQLTTKWPAEARDAKTFVELFRSCTAEWPQVLDDVHRAGVTIEAFAEDVYSTAEEVASEFEGVDVWHVLGNTLRRCLKRYDAGRGRFRTFFISCLELNLGRDQKRLRPKPPRRNRWDERSEAHFIRRALRHTDHRKPYRLYDRWMQRLYHDALDRLDAETRTFIRMKYRNKRTWAEVGEALGLTEAYVRKRFTVKAVAEAVRAAVRDAVEDLPDDDKALMVNHLYGWAKMTEA